MICLLGEPEDGELLYVAAALKRRDVDHALVYVEELMLGCSLTYRIDRNGTTSCLRFRDGRVWNAKTPTLVLNRLMTLPPLGGMSSPTDVNYVSEEWRAALVAWLRTLPCPVLNPPRAASLAGPALSMPAWRSIAAAHGLECRPWTSGVREGTEGEVSLVALGSLYFGHSKAMSPSCAQSLWRVARYTGTPLLGVTLEVHDDEWSFVDATPRPALSPLGEPFIDALIDCACKGALPQ